jgi:hypothetical protein
VKQIQATEAEYVEYVVSPRVNGAGSVVMHAHMHTCTQAEQNVAEGQHRLVDLYERAQQCLDLVQVPGEVARVCVLCLKVMHARTHALTDPPRTNAHMRAWW